MIDAVIFDMYGVVMTDPTGGLAPYMEQILTPEAYDELYVHWEAAANGEFGSQEFFRRLGFADIEKAEREYLDTIEIDSGFIAAAEKLRDSGIKLGLLSNDIGDWNEWLRKKYGLDRLFDAVAVSGDEGISKPDVRIFKIIAERLGVSPESCVYIDDRERFLSVAAGLGMKTIRFDNTGTDSNAAAEFEDVLQMLADK